MLTIKIAVYCITIAAMLFFAFREQYLKRRLTSEDFQPSKNIGDFGILNDLSEEMQRERILRGLPRRALRKYRMAVGLKFLLVAILIAEVIVLQKAK